MIYVAFTKSRKIVCLLIGFLKLWEQHPVILVLDMRYSQCYYGKQFLKKIPQSHYDYGDCNGFQTLQKTRHVSVVDRDKPTFFRQFFVR